MSERLRLVTRARRLGPAFDLLSTYRPGGFAFERSGLGVCGAGAALRIRVEGGPGRIGRLAKHVAQTLAEVTWEGVPPVAVGAVPFDENRPVELMVPIRATRRTGDGHTWAIELGPADGDMAAGATEEGAPPAPLATPHEAFAELQLRPEPPPHVYQTAVEAAVRAIRSSSLRKVVLARSIVVDAGRELDPGQLLRRVRAVDPDCFAFATPGPVDGPASTLVGATPELLVRMRSGAIEATPLAGSAPRFGDPERDRASARALLESAKDREEHQAVVDDVAEVLGSVCHDLTYPSEPELVGTANVWHLATPFRGRAAGWVRSVLEVVERLHPTAAVCGRPRPEAREALRDLEHIDRSSYAGPVGWVDANGDGEWAIALRCAEIVGRTARLFAGAGIVAGSVPEIELDETERKFRALLDALRWG
ncbi:MAG TPA: isochorismate synthase [Actinomycetota bacterium]|nr:isochorismate synthase [Actinomycetota bacterium]